MAYKKRPKQKDKRNLKGKDHPMFGRKRAKGKDSKLYGKKPNNNLAEPVYNDNARLTSICLLNNPKAFKKALMSNQILSLRNMAYKPPKEEFTMRVCKKCGGRIGFVDVDAVSITVQCREKDCKEEYQVEPDGLGEGGAEWAEAMELKQEGLL